MACGFFEKVIKGAAIGLAVGGVASQCFCKANETGNECAPYDFVSQMELLWRLSVVGQQF